MYVLFIRFPPFFFVRTPSARATDKVDHRVDRARTRSNTNGGRRRRGFRFMRWAAAAKENICFMAKMKNSGVKESHIPLRGRVGFHGVSVRSSSCKDILNPFPLLPQVHVFFTTCALVYQVTTIFCSCVYSCEACTHFGLRSGQGFSHGFIGVFKFWQHEGPLYFFAFLEFQSFIA